MPNESSDRPDEPAENISGGPRGGGEHTVPPAETAAAEPATRAEAVVDDLGDMYWQKAYGGQDAFECLVRTILSQNTSDKASQPAHDSLMARYGGSADRTGAEDDGSADRTGAEDDGSADRTGAEDDGSADRTGAEDGGDDLAAALATAEQDELAETISSAGLYNQKSETLIRLAGRIVEEYGGADDADRAGASGETGFDEFVKSGHPDEVREALLEMKGVGPKTADCVLLFSGGRGGVFPVDTHVHRIARRMGLAPADADHEEVREAIESAIPPEKCGFGHTAMIQFGREYCTARKPACLDGPEACPLVEHCDQVGIDELSGEVVDPADVLTDD